MFSTGFFLDAYVRTACGVVGYHITLSQYNQHITIAFPHVSELKTQIFEFDHRKNTQDQ